MSMQPTKEQRIEDLEGLLRYCQGQVNELTHERNEARAALAGRPTSEQVVALIRELAVTRAEVERLRERKGE